MIEKQKDESGCEYFHLEERRQEYTGGPHLLDDVVRRSDSDCKVVLGESVDRQRRRVVGWMILVMQPVREIKD